MNLIARIAELVALGLLIAVLVDAIKPRPRRRRWSASRDARGGYLEVRGK